METMQTVRTAVEALSTESITVQVVGRVVNVDTGTGRNKATPAQLCAVRASVIEVLKSLGRACKINKHRGYGVWNTFGERSNYRTGQRAQVEVTLTEDELNLVLWGATRGWK